MDPRRLSLRQLEVLTAVAETGSMAGAGRRLFMTGPGVTQQVQQLEKTLGMPVFDRLGAHQKMRVGYKGTMNLLFETANIFQENAKEAQKLAHN